MIRLFHGHKPVRAIEVSIGALILDTICSIGNERETQRHHGGKLRIDIEMRHDGSSLSEEIR